VEDAQIIYDSIYGHDVLDSTSTTDTTYPKFSLKKVIGVPWDLVNGEGVDPKVKENFKESIKKLEALGFKIKDISIKNIDIALATYILLCPPKPPLISLVLMGSDTACIKMEKIYLKIIN